LSDATRRAVWLGARIALLPALSVAFLVLLGMSSVVYVVDLEPEQFVVRTFGTRYTVPRTPNEPAWTNVVGEPRFSTRQLLFHDAGLVGNESPRGLSPPAPGERREASLRRREPPRPLEPFRPAQPRSKHRREPPVTIPTPRSRSGSGTQLVHHDIAIPWRG
jgi:hypothetical protein